MFYDLFHAVCADKSWLLLLEGNDPAVCISQIAIWNANINQRMINSKYWAND